MMDLSPKTAAILIGVPTAAVILYWLFRQKSDDYDEEDARKVTTSRHTVIEVKVPGKCAGAIIGRQGANIKEIQKKTGAKVNFKDDNQRQQNDDSERTIVIRGNEEGAQAAEILIREFVANMPKIITETITVPCKAVGRIIGRNGDTVRNISRTSKARVFVDRTKQEYRDVDRQVQIIGTTEQIELAKTLISEKIEEEEVFRAKQAVMEANRDKRQHSSHNSRNSQNSKTKEPLTPDPLNLLPPDFSPTVAQDEEPGSVPNTEPNSVPSTDSAGQVFPWPSGKEYIEVYVSSVADPENFWLQILSSSAMQLDELVVKMTAFYTSEQEKMPLSTLAVGDVVAAPFDMDTSWYRAKVMGIEGDKVDLFYLDYGDSCYIDKSQLRSVRSDFLVLPFQAIECQLAYIEPKDSQWSSEAVDRFEELTYSAKWQVLIAKRVGTRKFVDRGEVQVVKLFDTNTHQDVNIGQKLVAEGLAQWAQEGT